MRSLRSSHGPLGRWYPAILAALVAVLSAALALAQAATPTPRTYELRNSQWFDGQVFRPAIFYSDQGVLTRKKPRRVDKVVDLGGGFVVPPFGEAHNHNIEKLYNLESQTREYLEQGIFYVKISNDVGELAAQIRHRLDRPDSIDVAFAHGGLTASGGHPIRLYQEILRERAYQGVDKQWFDGRAYFIVDTEDDLRRKWSAIRAGRPDFLKTFLLYSEEFEKRREDPAFFGRKGLDPRLLPKIVQRAHGEGLRVSTHVETAADFRTALAAGADEVTHLPGYSIPAGEAPDRFLLTEEDARLAARRGLSVVTTTVLAKLRVKEPERLKIVRDVQARNLRLLHRHGVPIAAGSDNYELTSLDEVMSLRDLGVFDNRALLKLWCEATPRAVFPDRKIGKLENGFEASFLVLGGNPLEDFERVRDVRMRFKQGHPLELSAAPRKEGAQ